MRLSLFHGGRNQHPPNPIHALSCRCIGENNGVEEKNGFIISMARQVNLVGSLPINQVNNYVLSSIVLIIDSIFARDTFAPLHSRLTSTKSFMKGIDSTEKEKSIDVKKVEPENLEKYLKSAVITRAIPSS